MTSRRSTTSTVHGQWSGKFAPVADELSRQLRAAPDTGGAVCVYQAGQVVVDAFGGVRNRADEPWQSDTLVMAFSTGKGIAATLLHTLVDAGLADYEDRVADHWPEFARAGKADVTIRQLLSHRAGLYRLGDMIDDFWQILDFEAMAARVAAAAPAHVPGAASGYHGISFSWLLGELLQRVGKKSVAELLHERIVAPLQLDGAYFGLPESETARCAELVSAEEPLTLGHHALGLAAPIARALSLGRVRLDDLRSALVLPAAGGMSWNDLRLRRASLLSSTGVFTARALARVYAALAEGGSLDRTTLLSARVAAAAQQIQSRERDRVMGIAPEWRLGYHGIQRGGRFVPGAFGHCGYRGTGAFADPARRLSFAYLHNAKAGVHPMGEGRFQKLLGVALDCADVTVRS